MIEKKDIIQREPPVKKNKETWNIRPYLAIGLTAFIVISLCIILYFFIERYSGASEWLSSILSILQPILLGIFFAFLLNPVVAKFEEWLIIISTKFRSKFHKKHKLVSKKEKKEGKTEKARRGISITITMILVLFLLALLINLIVPQVAKSVENLITMLPSQAEKSIDWIQDFSKENEELSKFVESTIQGATDYLESWLKNDLVPQSKEILTSVTGGILQVLKGLLNFFIGLIVCVYVLIEKDHFKGIAKKLTYSIFPVKGANVILKVSRKSYEIFNGFIVGKLIDSAIIGVICYFVLLIFNVPYSLLVAVIVGITNIIPFFGPWIGAIPSAFLILIAEPIKALYFIVIIIIIQQFDGNILGPKILGSSTGLSSFWVVFAILLSGGLFGFLGMLLGVPTFAVIYYIINEISKYLLSKKNMPQKSDDYIYVKEVRDIDEKE